MRTLPDSASHGTHASSGTRAHVAALQEAATQTVIGLVGIDTLEKSLLALCNLMNLTNQTGTNPNAQPVGDILLQRTLTPRMCKCWSPPCAYVYLWSYVTSTALAPVYPLVTDAICARRQLQQW